MRSLWVEKKKKQVRFTLDDGSEILGEINLGFYYGVRIGMQRIDELMNEGMRFIPVITDKGNLLLNIAHIMIIRTKFLKAEHELLMMGKKQRILITTILRDTIEVDAYISMPTGYCRVSDYMNQPLQFFPFFIDDYILYVNKDFILNIQD